MPPSGDHAARYWDTWPCGLLLLDGNDVIVDVNDRFLHHTGYARANLVGQMEWTDVLAVGSRLLYQTRLAPTLTLNGAIDEVMIDLLGSDGRKIPALMSAATIRDSEGRPTGAQIALMAAPDRREYEDNLRRARETAERATTESDHARSRLELLASANAALASSVDVSVALGRLARVLAVEIADWCIIYALDDSHPEMPQLSAAAHRNPAKQADLDRLAELIPAHATASSAITHVLTDNAPILLATVTAERKTQGTDSPEMVGLYGTLGLASAMVIPSFARGHRVAALILARGPGQRSFTEVDFADVCDLGTRTGIAIDNLRLHARERSNSVALQHALLTAPPQVAPFEIVTRYLPATDGAEIGGDWYDAFSLPGGGVAVVIGDVVGHDIQAATKMGQLRGIIRTLAAAIPGTPGDILTQADLAANTLHIQTMASAIVAQIEMVPSDASGGRIAIWSNAGHPPPIVITRDGSVRVIEERSDPLLGLHLGLERHDHALDLHPGDTLLLYTDGLVERPNEDFDTGLARLTVVAAGGHAKTPTDLAEDILAGHDDRRDDIALLLFRITPETTPA